MASRFPGKNNPIGITPTVTGANGVWGPGWQKVGKDIQNAFQNSPNSGKPVQT